MAAEAHPQHHVQVRQCGLRGDIHLMWLQVPIFNIMRKFDGVTMTDDIRAGRRRFRITRLPRYMCLHMKRFTKV